jgi:hypothetical protein
MPFEIRGRVEDCILTAHAETANLAFAKAVEWQVANGIRGVSISDGRRRFTVAEFSLTMASQEIAGRSAIHDVPRAPGCRFGSCLKTKLHRLFASSSPARHAARPSKPDRSFNPEAAVHSPVGFCGDEVHSWSESYDYADWRSVLRPRHRTAWSWETSSIHLED